MAELTSDNDVKVREAASLCAERSDDTLIEGLSSAYGTAIYICPETSQLAHAHTNAPQYRETVLMRFGPSSTIGIVSRVKLLRRSMEHPASARALQRNFLPAIINSETNAQRITIRDLSSQRLYRCCPDSEPLSLKEADTQESSVEMTCFTLSSAIPQDLLDCATSWHALVVVRDEAPGVMAALTAFPPDMIHEVLPIAIELMSKKARHEFLSYFLADQTLLKSHLAEGCAAICAALPCAAWLPQALEGLRAWLQDREAPMPRQVGRAFDFLGQDATWSSNAPHSSAISLLHALRVRVQPQRKLAVVACARDEGLYLLEWIAVHRLIGVEKFFIYTNDLCDGSDVMLARLHEAGIIHWIDNTGSGRAGINCQTKAYAHALSLLPALLDYEWCLTIDLDEWFLPAEDWHQNLPAFLESFSEDIDAVVATWRINGPDRALRWTNALSSDRFVALETHPLVKSVFRPKRFLRAAPHVPIPLAERNFVTVDGVHHGVAQGDIESASFCATRTVQAEVFHFNIRSFEEFVWRYARGENDGNAVLPEKNFRYNDPGIFELFTRNFDATGPRCAAVVSARCQIEIEHLLTLPGVRSAWETIVTRYQTEVSRYVHQSVVSVTQDARVPNHVRQRWCDLFNAWDEARAADVPSEARHALDAGHVF